MVVLRTPITQMIIFNQGMLLLDSNYFLIYAYYCLLFFSLSDLGLTSILTDTLQCLPNLEELDLSKNKLTAIKLDGVMPQVKTLSLSSNQLCSVDGLIAFPSLESVDVTNNPTLEVSKGSS